MKQFSSSLHPARGSCSGHVPVLVVREFHVCRSSSDRNKGFSSQENSNTIESNVEKVSNPSQQATREDILAACVSTSGILGLVSLAVHAASPFISPAAQEDIFQRMYENSLIGHIGIAECAAMLATAGAVTGFRVLLLQNWPEFKQATDVSNTQILVPIKNNGGDIAVVAGVPAIAEELLFRWALLPAVYPDWRGAVISGLVFGVLHTNGGRNSAFAAWASCVGCAYGFLYLYSGSAAVAAGAHALANLLSATLWLRDYESNE